MASEVDYTAPQWNPPTTPPTPGNPARMQALADAVEECADRAINQTIATAINASTIVAGTQWGSGNDGNGGRPPAPKTLKTVVSLAQNAYVDIGTANNSAYLVYADNSAVGGVAVTLFVNESSLWPVPIVTAAGAVSVESSGDNIRITQLYTGTRNIHYAVIQLAWAS